MTDAMISVEEAHARVTGLFTPIGTEEVPLAHAAGRVLARDVLAARAQPPFAASAMDGYAIRAQDFRSGNRLSVIGSALAGAGFVGEVGPGEAVRIFTGAPVPAGAERVLIQEDADRIGDHVTVRQTSDRGANIRPAGGDFVQGACFPAPCRIGSAEMALLAAMNASQPVVARKPVVALIPTGDELVIPGENPGPDQILCSNSYGLKAMLEAAGAQVRLLPIAQDDPRSLVAAFGMAAGADLIVTLGGASVGDFDLVQKTAIRQGLVLDFYKIAMRPGKPLMAGRLGRTPFIGLPGNPVSAMVCGLLFLRPAVEAMLGLPAALPERYQASLLSDVRSNGPRSHYMRARVTSGPDGWVCDPFSRQDSSLLTVLAAANALLIRPPGDPERKAGYKAEFIWTN